MSLSVRGLDEWSRMSSPVQGAKRRAVGCVAVVAVAVTLVSFLAGRTAGAQIGPPAAVPSDARATFVAGNISLCSEAPLNLPASEIQVGAEGNTSASDANVSGTVQPNDGPIQPGSGEELNVTITGTGVVIDAVVVKGSNGFNVYEVPFVPPAEAPPQSYIAPLTGTTPGGGNVPNISHWFVCYHVETPPPAGSISVDKEVVAPRGPPAVPLPTEVSVDVTCGGETVTVTFGAGGGAPGGPVFTDLPEGTVCTVVEQGVGDLPPGTVVTYSPAGADSTGVVIGTDEAVTVTVTNDLSGVEVQTGQVRMVKVVAPGLDLPSTIQALIACTDGSAAAVTLPGDGGEGTPVVEITTGAFCALVEVTPALPPGTTVTYSVDGGPPVSDTPVHVGPIVTDTAIEVTITNDPPDAPPPTTPPTTPATAPPTPPTAGDGQASPIPPGGPTDTLPATGSGTPSLLLAAAGLIVAGLLVRRGARRAGTAHGGSECGRG